MAAEAVAAPPASLPDCGVADPVRVASIRLADGSTLDLPGRPLLDCPFAADFAGFARDLVAPLGAAMLGAPVVALETGPGYECRGRNQVPGAKTSAHGQGIAIDVSAVVLADRRRVAVARQADAREEAYLRAARRAACGWFTTVLGPGSDAAHADHLHLDALRHGASGDYRICGSAGSDVVLAAGHGMRPEGRRLSRAACADYGDMPTFTFLCAIRYCPMTRFNRNVPASREASSRAKSQMPRQIGKDGLSM